MDNHPLKILLQLQLGTDASAVLHLPYVLRTLSVQTFSPASVHLQKWSARISSLIHSKDAGARWAGLCIALKTSTLYKSLMIECAQSWVGVALPMLSKNESMPCLKSSIRLVRYIFSNAGDVPEFQRQVVTPNVTKFSQALLSLVEKVEDEDLKILCLGTLSQLVPAYPSSHRALHASLSSLTLKYLNGSSPKPSSKHILQVASQLYSVLPLTGGKVGASTLWRKSVDETLIFTWAAFSGLRSTFPQERAPNSLTQENSDPLVTIPLNLDRLHCGIVVLSHLLSVNTPRPVQFPVGALTKLCVALLSCNADEQIQGHVDETVRVMELSLIPEICSLGCDFLESLVKCTQFHTSPHVTRISSCITFQLEAPNVQKLPFLRAIPPLLTNSHPLSNPIIPNRLIKATLPSLTSLLSSESDAKPQDESGTGTGRKKGKKRARGYEGDEVFKTAREVLCATEEDGDVVIAALEALQALLHDPGVTPAVQSLTTRILLSLHSSLPRLSPPSLSGNLALHDRVCTKVQELCIELGSGNASVMSRSLPLVIGLNQNPKNDMQKRLDLLLHPRLPPLVRPMPPVDALYLFRAEENQEEADLRRELGLETTEAEPGMDLTVDVDTSQPDEVVHEQQNFVQPAAPKAVSQPQNSWQPSATAGNLQGTIKQIVPVTSLPPMTSSAITSPFPSEKSNKEHITRPEIIIAPSDDEDEEMPGINVDSDSD